MALTENQIQAEIDRVSALTREYIASSEKYAEEQDYNDIRFQTWQVGCIIEVHDEDDQKREIVTGAFESSSRTLQTGMVMSMLIESLDM
jgi:hypothetical protein